MRIVNASKAWQVLLGCVVLHYGYIWYTLRELTRESGAPRGSAPLGTAPLGTASPGPPLVTGEVFESPQRMEKLEETHQKRRQLLEGVVQRETEKLKLLKRHLAVYAHASDEAASDFPTFVHNPINGFLLLKRLTIDWQVVQSLIPTDVANMTETGELPTLADLDSAAEALAIGQDTYKLETKDLAEGIIKGKKHAPAMNAHDCFVMGMSRWKEKDWYHAALWLNMSLTKHSQEVDPLIPTSRADILDLLAYAMFQLGNIPAALRLTEQYLALVPNCSRNIDNVSIYKTKMKGTTRFNKPDESYLKPTPMFYIPGFLRKYTLARGRSTRRLIAMYEKLCRGDVPTPQALRCRYVDHGNPYLRLARVKVEEVNLDPRILLYHEVIHDSEIKVIQEMAKPLFGRSAVVEAEPNSIKSKRSNIRQSQTTFLSSNSNAVMQRVTKRSAIITNLVPNTAEDLQVLNYGIGGHYVPHTDNFWAPSGSGESVNLFKNEVPPVLGNRLATLLFYMSDVTHGGATVFPIAEVGVFPRRGSAVFWKNLLPDGRGDARTLHGACPILLGSKWACNKWYHY